MKNENKTKNEIGKMRDGEKQLMVNRKMGKCLTNIFAHKSKTCGHRNLNQDFFGKKKAEIET